MSSSGVQRVDYRKINASTWDVEVKTYMLAETAGKVKVRTEVTRTPWYELPDDMRAFAIRTGATAIRRGGDDRLVAVVR